eukprot:gene17481-20857_t
MSQLTKDAIDKMAVKDLQRELTAVGLDTKGKKADLHARLLAHLQGTPQQESSASADNGEEEMEDDTTSDSATAAPMDITKMAPKERALYRADKFRTTPPTRGSANPTTVVPSSLTAISSPTQSQADRQAELEKIKSRREKFSVASANATATDTAATTSPSTTTDNTTTTTSSTTPSPAKVRMTKIDPKDSVNLSTQAEIIARKKKFGIITAGPSAGVLGNDDDINRRLKKFGTTADTTETTTTQ